MKRVIVRNKEGIKTAGAEMEDPTAWISGEVANNSWGLPGEYTVETIDITSEVEAKKQSELARSQNKGKLSTLSKKPDLTTAEVKDAVITILKLIESGGL